ncbi:replication stress response regulator SDE2 [Ischnura elegans]|uniref:replication stress response regulator SDE2 n=1 Tax=Ischnura elegans TaxID=197161 RepID=UPI001ED8BD7B|nr:replication stress response regulator SDE2 [Ischnura elegans]XP_046392684.1 replication stress response regulator SDE2 [Ischnura elegans]XP_046392685.1 replication stress response regulator SDE2 [Ischnura elegans]
MLLLYISHLKKTVVLTEPQVNVEILDGILPEYTGNVEDFYYVRNGKRVDPSDEINDGVIHAVPRLRGGKGGFGSMLRAIGAQIEKTTNREACRDLSGRRLRDINEEKRLKNWIAQQADREREAAEKRKKKLERLCAEPKHEFQDKEYEKQRSDLSEKVWDAVDQGMKASTSSCSMPSTSQKRKLPEPKKPSKKSCLWVADIDDISSCDSDDSDEDKEGTEKPSKSSLEAVPDVKGEKKEKNESETSCDSVHASSNSEESTGAPGDIEGTSAVTEKESGSEENGQEEALKKEVLAV